MIQSLLIEVQVNDEPPQIAMNETVIAAGHPFRILELGVAINGNPAPHIRADGIILSTPLGSTAHNASAGGPIVDPEANSMVLTPLAAHSLAVRPIVLNGNVDVAIEILQANEGTSLMIDGAVQCPLQTGTRVRVRRSSQALSIVLNPTYTYWKCLSRQTPLGCTARITRIMIDIKALRENPQRFIDGARKPKTSL